MAGTRTEKAILAFISGQNGSRTLKETESVMQEATDRLMKENFQTKERVSQGLRGRFELLEVQYNPFSLNLTGSGGDMELDDSSEGEADKVIQKINPGTVSLSMELVIDGPQTQKWAVELLQRAGRELERKVIFCWGNMVFPGDMTQADVQYHMFANTGEPQMGKISITISQKSPEDSKYWKRAFETCFQTI